ncbi:hypothetical protein K502DRAFT_354025 [Neoconidiobolus thromboides FSU 785]|nr:hypothetical protein K502DRAFT_354025 [Neoconidiobolus thromboides FSU 785]
MIVAKEKPPNVIFESILIMPINPLKVNNNYYNTELFSHSHEIDGDGDINITVPEKLHPKATRGVSMMKEKKND